MRITFLMITALLALTFSAAVWAADEVDRSVPTTCEEKQGTASGTADTSATTDTTVTTETETVTTTSETVVTPEGNVASPMPSNGASKNGASSSAVCPLIHSDTSKPGMAGMPMDHASMMDNMRQSIAVDATAVYVVRGDQVVKLDKNTLAVLSQTTLPGSGLTMQQYGAAMGSNSEMRPHLNRMGNMSGKQVDRTFLRQMIRNHAGSIEMSRLALDKATHEELKAFAQKTIDAQTTENTQMSGWMKSWHKVDASRMPAPMADQAIQRLRGLSGKDFEIAYIRAMIMANNDAADLASVAVDKAAKPEVRSLATKMVDAHGDDAAQLTRWLSDWYNVQP